MLEEMLTAQATIQAAEIQKWGSIWAAFIGGAALALGVWFSWRTSLHLQTVARLAETRKNVYLDLVGSYSDMITGFHTLLLDFNKKWPLQVDAIMSFGKKADIASFICETETKADIFEFLKSFQPIYFDFFSDMKPIQKLSEELDDLVKRHDEIMSRFDDAWNILQKIKIEEPDNQKIKNILDYIDTQLKYGDEQILLITQKENELIQEKKVAQACIEELIQKLNESVLPITHLLRKELGAKTNIELDTRIHKEIK